MHRRHPRRPHPRQDAGPGPDHRDRPGAVRAAHGRGRPYRQLRPGTIVSFRQGNRDARLSRGCAYCVQAFYAEAGTAALLSRRELEFSMEHKMAQAERLVSWQPKAGVTRGGRQQNNHKKVDCNSTARKFSEIGNRLALGAGGSALVFGALGAEPVAAILGGAALAGDGISFVAGGYVYLTEGDSGPLKSSFVGAAFGAVGGAGVKLFGGRSFSPVAGTRVTIRPSNTSVEAGKYAGGQAAGAVPSPNTCP